jgi:tRNA(Ile)-lysidine synthase
MGFNEKNLDLQNYFESKLDKNKQYLVAVSGGVDSIVLGFLMKKLGYNFLAITVDHNLRKNSKKDAEFTVNYLKTFDINCILKTWHGKVKKNLEQEAREARYLIFEEVAIQNNISEILTAHHLDDQIETFFMNLMRGSGLNGLCAMPKSKALTNNIKLSRPLLEVPKSDILDYAIKNNLQWVEDETNSDEKFTRNKIRKIITGFEYFEELKPRILMAIEHLQGVKTIIDDIVQREMQAVILSDVEGSFKKDWFLNLKAEIQFGILREIILHFSDKKPRFSSLKTWHDLILSGEIKRITISNLLVSVRKKEVFFKVWESFGKLD